MLLKKFRPVILPSCLIAGAIAIGSAKADPDLRGHAEKRAEKRVQRPASGAEQRFDSRNKDGYINVNEFALDGKVRQTDSNVGVKNIGITGGSGEKHISVSPSPGLKSNAKAAGTTQVNNGGTVQRDVKAAEEPDNEEQPPKEEQTEREANRFKRVMIHLTGYDEADEISATINRDGLKMAQALNDIGVRVTILLDRSAVKLGAKGCREFSIKNTPVSFVKLMDRMCAGGVEIIANGDYSREYAPVVGGLREGIKALDDKDIARKVIKENQILEFAGPLFPAIYTGPVKKGSIMPDPHCGCGGIEKVFKEYGFIK